MQKTLKSISKTKIQVSLKTLEVLKKRAVKMKTAKLRLMMTSNFISSLQEQNTKKLRKRLYTIQTVDKTKAGIQANGFIEQINRR